MLSVQAVRELINDKSYSCPKWLEQWRDVYYGMSLHIDGARPAYWVHTRTGSRIEVKPANYFGVKYQELFECTIFNRHQREDLDTLNWRMSCYRPHTQDPFLRIINVVTGTLFQESNYVIRIEDKQIDDYIWGPNFEGRTLAAYVEFKFKAIAEDPNAVFVVLPHAPWYEIQGGEVKPYIHFVHTKDMVFISKDEIIYIDRTGPVPVKWWVNRLTIFRYVEEQPGNDTWVDMDGGKGYYTHNRNRTPYHFAGGQWNAQGFFESWFAAGKAVADEYAGAKSASQMADKEVSHPFVQIANIDCPTCDGAAKVSTCRNCGRPATVCGCGWAADDVSRYDLVACNRCGGLGKININPGQYIQAAPEDMDKELIKLINPDVKINEYHANNARQIFKDLIAALHLYHVEEAQSAVAKDKDLETRYQFFNAINNDLFGRLIPGLAADLASYNSVSVVNGQLVPAEVGITVERATSYIVMTSGELLAEYDAAKKGGLPAPILARMLMTYVDKKYGGDPLMLRYMEVAAYIDPLITYSPAEVEAMVTAGAVDARAWKLHLELMQMLNVLAAERKEWFLTAPLEEVRAEVMRRFDQANPPPLALPPANPDES